jgi:DNA-binding Xre family transcriptional regulator
MKLLSHTNGVEPVTMVDSANMPIKLRIREVAEGRGFQNARELADAAGIAATTAYAYWNNTSENISRTVLGKICKALGVHVYAMVDDDFVFEETVAPETVRRPGRGRPPKASS